MKFSIFARTCYEGLQLIIPLFFCQCPQADIYANYMLIMSLLQCVRSSFNSLNNFVNLVNSVQPALRLTYDCATLV